jgi:predicted DNA-binding transcriptional regulator YafY
MSRLKAEKLLEKMLVMVPWVMNHEQGPTVEEVCEQFSMSESELVSSLELLFVCGVYPFTPDALIEADIVDGRVWIRSAEAFERPPFFRPEEALALVAAASASLALPGNQDNTELQSALAKLTEVLGMGEDDAVEVSLTPTSAKLLDQLRNSIKNSLVVELDYYSNGRDEWSHRRVQPLQVFNREGHWYLQARSDESAGNRTFRVDRMRNVEPTDEGFDPPTELAAPTIYTPRPEDPTIVLELDSRAHWVAEQYPTHDVKELGEGRLRVTLPVSERVWAQRLLLRLGSHARVVEGDIDPTSSAMRILSRYGQ